MDGTSVSTIGTLIGSLGFPIVACIGLAWYLYKVQTKATEAINNNSLILQKLLDKLDGKDETK